MRKKERRRLSVVETGLLVFLAWTVGYLIGTGLNLLLIRNLVVH